MQVAHPASEIRRGSRNVSSHQNPTSSSATTGATTATICVSDG